ncbi:Ankyrin-1 [Araneus ventricosus]|uniref:Alpha-latrotoxin n=1 Tax=Araneus ventricosus TaxID=182803 RepID=A0A4Y2KAW6_ARAVE|nr:Ankyrin-1 [Araneus ventricosus]
MARHRKDYNLLSLSAESSERVVNEFNDLDEVHAKFLYTDILKAVQKVLEDDKIDCLRNLSIVLTEISKTKNNECLQIYQHSDRKENFNLVSLACKNKAVKALNYIFSEKPQTLYNLSVKLTGVRKNELLFSVTDEFRHNAFYYAIRSNMTDLLNTLVNRWQSQYSDEELDDLLSQSYKELKLRNVSMAGEMQMFVQSKILDLRFSHASRCGNSGTGNSCEQIKKRIKLVVKYIRSAKDDYWDRDPDDKFILIAEFIVKNIYVLKSLLKSTYDRLPWEEIEFCLTIFIRCCKSSSKQNLVYNCVLNKKQMLKHLFNFSLVLDTQHDKFENSNVMQLAKNVKLLRESVIDKIKENSNEFRELYDDFEKIRDFCSLEIIKSYADLLKSSDAPEKRRHLLVSRVLQVMGEHLKNTLDSPKLSTKTANILLSSLSLEIKDIITELRDALSHEETLFIRSEIEKKAYLFKNILTNILRIQDMISDMLCTMGIASVKILMKKVKLCESTEDIKECYGPCRHSLDLYSEEIEKTNLIKSDFELFEELLQCLDKYINYNARWEKILYEQLHYLIQKEKQRLQNLKQEFHEKAAFVSYFNTYSSNENVSAIIRSKADALADFPLEAPAKETKKIGELLKELFGIVAQRVLPSENMELNYILYKYFNFMNSEMGSVKWIEELGKIVNQNKISIMCRNSNKKHKQKLSHNVSQNLLKSKFSQLKEALTDFAFEDGTSCTDFSSFEGNKELQAVTEMLVLDILCLLENSCSRNPFFLDSDFPVIAGKNLRNHLAHRNTLIDVFLEESSAQLFVNAKKILTAEASKNSKKMDKIIKCDFIKLGTSIECDLRIISNQQKLFFALEEGNVKEAEECVSGGADVYGRDCNSSTCLHFAGRAPDCAALEWVLRQGLDINSKDSSGQTVFHTAAKFNRIEVIRYLVDRKQMSLGISDENGKRLLHFPAKASDISALKWILKQELYINSNKRADQIVSHIASKLNSIEEKQYWVERKHMLLDIGDENGKTPLDVAVENQSISVVEYISKLEINSSVKDKNGSTAFLIAMYRHNKDTAKVLLEKGANIDEIKVHLNIPVLHIAAESGNINLVKLLIAKRHKIDSKTEFGLTPLHLATVMGHFEIVKALVVNGADVNVKDETGTTPLLDAASLGSLEIVDFLLQHGADINVSDCRRFTPLIRAAAYGHISVTELLLEKGAFVNSKDICGITPLHFAAERGHCEIVELLLNHNAIIDCKSNSNLTPLYVSASSGHKEIVELLIKEGAKINATESTNSTPLHAAAAAGHVDIVDLLIVEGADINFKNQMGSTALHLATSNADRAVVESLLEKGADIRAIDANKDTPLYFLISSGLSDLLTLDFRDVDSSDANGCTLFHSAALAGDQTLVEYCIENRCDIKARDNFGSTALHLAAQGNHHEIVSLLLNKDADINAKNDDGKTPLMYAIICNCTEAVEVLVSHKIKDFMSNMDEKIEALRLAVFHDNYKIIDILLQNFKFDNSNKNIQGLLNYAMHKDNKHLVAAFSERGFEINGDAKLLHFAANCSRHYMAELLLSKGADPNLLDENNSTPIDIAVLKNDAEMVEILLSEKADIRISSKSIFSAAEKAVVADKFEIIKLLLQIKVIKINTKLERGKTFLHIAASCGKLDATKYLIAEGADIHAKDEEGREPVHIAAEKGFKDLVEFYLDCNDLEKERGSLLIAAASYGKANVCDLLLKRNYKANACHVNEAIIIKSALVKDHKEVLSVLLHYGAYYNAHPLPQIDNGAASLLTTVKKLFTAVQNNAPSEVETLLKAESNPKYFLANARCVRKGTVLHCALGRIQ